VVPVFILDPGLMGSRYNGEKRTAFLLGGLRALDRSLRERGSRLILREGDPERELGKLKEEVGAEAIFVEQDVSPYFRIFNPTLQGKRLIPTVPTFPASFPSSKARNPPRSTSPRNPIVSHMEARIRALAGFQASRNKE
jgi:deoxyribodipyrimidine photolyase